MDAPITALVGAISGLVVSYLTIRLERERLHAEFKAERSVEAALTAFLGLPQHPYRSFPMIQHHIGGFEENELRQHPRCLLRFLPDPWPSTGSSDGYHAEVAEATIASQRPQRWKPRFDRARFPW